MENQNWLTSHVIHNKERKYKLMVWKKNGKWVYDSAAENCEVRYPRWYCAIDRNSKNYQRYSHAWIKTTINTAIALRIWPPHSIIGGVVKSDQALANTGPKRKNFIFFVLNFFEEFVMIVQFTLSPIFSLILSYVSLHPFCVTEPISYPRSLVTRIAAGISLGQRRFVPTIPGSWVYTL